MKKGRIQEYVVSYDKTIFICYLALCLIGAVIMLDITSIQDSMTNFYHHLINLTAAFIALVVVLYYFNLEKLRRFNGFFIFLVIFLLVLVLVFGKSVNGATRQLRIGWFSFQPSFLARMVLVCFFASLLSRKPEELRTTEPKRLLVDFLPLILSTLVIFGLIIWEKHLSTLVIGGMTLLGMLIYAGLRKRMVLSLLLICIFAFGLVILKGDSYRADRLQAFLNYNLLTRDHVETEQVSPEYQVHESLTALTSGSWKGTGMGKGRAKHFYLPEARTDYIYTVIGEEFGFLGALLVFALHALLFFKAFKIAEEQKSLYYKFLCAGLAMNIFLNALVNTGVAMAILPPTGNTLPFISYGGTALLVDSISVGMILNISAVRRQL